MPADQCFGADNAPGEADLRLVMQFEPFLFAQRQTVVQAESRRSR